MPKPNLAAIPATPEAAQQSHRARQAVSILAGALLVVGGTKAISYELSQKVDRTQVFTADCPTGMRLEDNTATIDHQGQTSFLDLICTDGTRAVAPLNLAEQNAEAGAPSRDASHAFENGTLLTHTVTLRYRESGGLEHLLSVGSQVDAIPAVDNFSSDIQPCLILPTTQSGFSVENMTIAIR